MTAPTKIPQGVIRIERGPTYKVTIINPFEASDSNSNEDSIKTLRIYHGVFPGDTLQVCSDVALAFVDPSTKRFIEVEFTPPQPGVFAFSFLNGQDPIEEGILSGVIEFVYGRVVLLENQLTLQRCIEIEAIDVIGEMIDASRAFDTWTERFFYPKWIACTGDGQGAYLLTLEHPIIYVAELFVRQEFFPGANINRKGLIDPSRFVVYNRHIQGRNGFTNAFPTRPDGFLETPGDGTGGKVVPDDRESPRVSFRTPNKISLGRPNVRKRVFNHRGGIGQNHFRDVGFTVGQQNILVKGFFGYTEPDLSTPPMVQRATDLLAVRESVIRWGSRAESEMERVRHKTIMEKTDTHLWMGEAKDRLQGAFTGDPEIDRALVRYTRSKGAGVV